ncbi:hypothetical protein ATANTOWER_030632 [Ataeniobius toweri]|uniref:Secreted protein n=1 Tax=Ataeniobius toweri TaxID=208326 RepID=A0ABU7B951_9TELE|nr:hypothetical protein [Ataeniobius toweri]
MSVGMCYGVRLLFFCQVESWAAQCPRLGKVPPSNVGPLSSMPHSLPVICVAACRIGGFRHSGLGALVCADSFRGCLPGPGPPGSVGPLFGVDVPWGLESLGS